MTRTPCHHRIVVISLPDASLIVAAIKLTQKYQVNICSYLNKMEVASLLSNGIVLIKNTEQKNFLFFYLASGSFRVVKDSLEGDVIMN